MTGVLTLVQVARYGFDHMNGWGWVPATVGFLFMAALIGLIVWLIASARKPDFVPLVSGRARALLDERYARGEIDREEYLGRKADLEG